MTTSVETADPSELIVADELKPEALLELRRGAHCVVEKRAKLDPMVADFSAVSKKFSSENKAEVRRGSLLWILGRVEEAIPVLQAARSSRERAYILGLCYLDVGRYQDAVPQLKEALEAETDNAEVKVAYLESKIRSGAFEEAEKMVTQMAKKFAASPEYHFLVGLLHDLQGFHEPALAAYEKALEVEPGHARALFRVAHTLDLRGDDARAVELYEQLRKLRPCHVNTMINLGTIYEDRGEYDRAVECFKAVIDYYPNHPRAKLYLRDAVASQSMFYDEDAARREQKMQQVLTQPLAEISCSPRVRTALQRLNILTLGDLVAKTEEEFLGLPNFGRTSLREVRELLTARGLNLKAGEGAAAPEEPAAVVAVPGEIPSGDVPGRSLLEFEWSGRIRKVFEKMNVTTVGDLLKITESDLLKSKNLGMTSIKEIRKRLGQLGVAMKEE